MNRCCRTCVWFRGGGCVREEMKNNLEDILEEIIVNMKRGITNPMVLNVVDVIGDAIIERSSEMKFIPPNHEFYCKYYEQKMEE